MILPAQLPWQRIPRRIFQTGRSFKSSVKTHLKFMTGWWGVNPDYEYSFFSDIATLQLVERYASPMELAAYRAVRTGAQKADLFRLLVLRYLGGVYADVDTELRVPLRSVIPSNASATVGGHWGTEFLAFEPGHPLLVRGLHSIIQNVHRQLRWIRQGNTTAHCGSPHSCVLLVTGPMALRAALARAAKTLGCKLPGKVGSAPAMTPSCPEAVRNMHVCTTDKGNVYRTWTCGAAFHWDCRNSGASRRCPANHYSRHRRGPGTAGLFFNTSRGFSRTGKGSR